MMLCEKCRTREANIRYTEVINGIKTEHNLCSQCAREMDFGHYSAMFDTDYPIGNLLSDLFGLTGEETEQEDAGLDQVVCPTCHTAYSDFVKNSRFGCPDCYGVFDLLMSENIKRIQGSVNHKGKHPRFHYENEFGTERKASGTENNAVEKTGWNPEDAEREEKLAVLKSKLQEAILEEEYEQAAKYRDEIRELKERTEKHA